MFNRNYLVAAVAGLALQAALPAAAAEDSCCFRLTPYYWAVGIDGKIEDNKANEHVNFNNSISDISDNLDFNGSLMLEHHLGRWVNFGSIDYMQTTNDDTKINIPNTKVKVETDSTMATLATGYRFGAGGESWTDLMVGARYAKLDVKAKVKSGGESGRANADDDLVDGIVMLRPRIALGKNWAFSPTASVGAGDSDLVWELAPEFVYTNNCCNLEFRFGYRTVNYEVKEGNTKLDFEYAGPMAGIGFAF